VDFNQVAAIVKELKEEKDRLLPFVSEVVEVLEEFGSVIEPAFRKLFIKKSVEYVKEKFELLMASGFTREEAFQIVLADKQMYQRSFDNGLKSSKK
jgi:site-specific recombinase XerD